MLRTFLFLLGFGLTVMGCTYFLIYLNLFTVGYTFKEYFFFCIKRIECIYALVGFVMMSVVCFWKGEQNDLYL